MKKIYIGLILLIAVFAFSCKKILDVGTPENQLTSDKVFADSVTAESAITGTYALFNTSIDPAYNRSLALFTDDLQFTGADQNTVDFFQSTVAVDNTVNLNIWRYFYQAVYNCNDIIHQLENSPLPESVKTRFTCEAKFLRAYAYFYLVNMYGKIPLLTSTSIDENRQATQSPAQTVYQQIIDDLLQAKNGLSADYRGVGKVRANKWAVESLLAKVYLFLNNNAEAENEASSVINSNLYTPLNPLATVFLAESKETILSFYTINGFIGDAGTLVPSSAATQYPITPSLANTFEINDARKTNWLKSITSNGITYSFPYKYHNQTNNSASPEYLVALRVSEVYLIRALARARQSKITEAVADLNIVRKRAGLTPLASTISQQTAVDAINHELQVELFTENGNRFLYLKCSGLLKTSLSTVKSSWKDRDALLPIPQKEITYDQKLVQNTGY